MLTCNAKAAPMRPQNAAKVNLILTDFLLIYLLENGNCGGKVERISEVEEIPTCNPSASPVCIEIEYFVTHTS